MNELTDGQIENIYLDHRDQLPNIPLIRAIITADRAQRQAEQEPAAAIAALERIAGDLQTLCDKQALMLGELEAQLEAVGADCESWYKQNQQSIDDANKFGGERDSAWAEVERLKADALRAAVAPDSWVLVPLEPTAEMLQAGQDTPVSESDEDAPEDYKAVYRAMLAAAPHPQQIAGLDKDAEIAALKAERDALLKNDARYRFVVSSTDHSMAKWHDCEGWYAIEEVDLDADMQAQGVKS